MPEKIQANFQAALMQSLYFILKQQTFYGAALMQHSTPITVKT